MALLPLAPEGQQPPARQPRVGHSFEPRTAHGWEYPVHLRGWGPEDEKEAAGEVGLPFSTSLARSSWPELQKKKGRDWSRRTLNRKAFPASNRIHN
jgi:hypothetical protein